MASSKVINQQAFHDGRVVLYQLENRPKKLWLARLKVPGGKGYVYRGTGTTDLYEARKFADELLEDLRINIKLGRSLTKLDVKRLVDEFEAHTKTNGTQTNWDATVVSFLKLYFVPYFSKNPLTNLNDEEIVKFFDWRKTNFKRRPPKSSTIIHEISELNSFLDWCQRRGHIKNKIEIQKPKQDGIRRAHFDSKDWSKLTRFLREWVKRGKNKSGPIFRDRLLLTNYILILANTGIRVGEARGLKWRNIDSHPTDDPKESNIIVHVKGKTGSREVVARTSEVKTYFTKIWDLRVTELDKEPSKDGLVFCHKDGRAITSFKKGFSTLLHEAGVEFDPEGNKRTIYSLRHTYATFRLHEGVNHYVLARNMGTSVKMLENFYGHTSNRAMASELTKNKSKLKSSLPWE